MTYVWHTYSLTESHHTAPFTQSPFHYHLIASNRAFYILSLSLCMSACVFLYPIVCKFVLVRRGEEKFFVFVNSVSLNRHAQLSKLERHRSRNYVFRYCACLSGCAFCARECFSVFMSQQCLKLEA